MMNWVMQMWADAWMSAVTGPAIMRGDIPIPAEDELRRVRGRNATKATGPDDTKAAA